MLAKSFTLSLACAALAAAQSSGPSFTASVAPAAETVAPDSTPANVQLFEAETVQLTDKVLSGLQNNPDTAQYASLFEFANSTLRTRHARRSLRCKTMPGDALYPSKLVWSLFDMLLGGALEKIVPIGSVCYPNSEYKNYDAEKCAYITENWDAEKIYYDDNGALMNPLYYGMTCPIPGTGNSTTCTQGGYSEYAVKISNVAQIQLAVNLARTLDLRLVVRNTGHDYVGRSVGKGALSVWTHGLKDIQYIENYESSTYSGPVFKAGAGVQGFELLQAAEKYGVSAVAGICPTVGVTGGYTTGGGHSPLMQLFGVGSDQALALEVVLANGRFVTATPTVNSDLYWAMLGGGGGTFGIVTSIVLKVHPKIPVTVTTWSIISQGISVETFWAAFRFYYDSFPVLNEAKTYSYFQLMKLAPGTYFWNMNPFFSTNKTIEETNALLKPFYDKCVELGINLTVNNTYYESVYPAYHDAFGGQNYYVGGAGATPANRLLPTENWADEDIRNKTFAAVQSAVEDVALLNMYHQHAADEFNTGKNSVNPAFRNLQSQIVAINSITDQTAAGWKAAVAKMTATIMRPLREITPTGGAYGNEADIGEPDWQQSFWGKNYPKLLKIKQEYDPFDLFYVYHGVGSERWAIEDNGIVGVQSSDGPLCRV
ncbi:FAD-binding domain-containing protein [Dothidotthia symphoricarpi CBS 119687]|uniref:FAD-binding domain-containing protein n=1 Tax=Dothidotthia symphoricarpi CBS 119687 TaxID=1392245 RepID=A0A6A6AR96_9PLEO|nr:FAD-binding domain-containing protein [Dothidotthia symphoricarpi CBS 119687]KAF2133474.1 FAD-binding domain-containing protein [Dothidotthia symphoricarpi CBS 119687]